MQPCAWLFTHGVTSYTEPFCRHRLIVIPPPVMDIYDTKMLLVAEVTSHFNQPDKVHLGKGPPLFQASKHREKNNNKFLSPQPTTCGQSLMDAAYAHYIGCCQQTYHSLSTSKITTKVPFTPTDISCIAT